ncbi:MAG: right-handed parallel beta-helix repeat-containing protein [Planctomycetes bacterium]|nr:right-handed parallel beta-helix repeat-containing protein [Planctomycetota bacterium]
MVNHHLISRRAVHTVMALIAILLLSSIAHGGGLLFVDDDAPSGGDGINWDTAYRFLADALVAAGKGQVGEIRVAQGVYKPDRDEANPDGTGDREATFQLINGLALMGGYAGIGAKDPDARDIELYETILSGDLLGNDGPGFANNDENSYHVTTGSGTNTTAILDGMAITAGNADGSNPDDRGGGMYIGFGSPTVTNCTFRANSANEYGGGMYNRASAVTVANCTFADNYALGIITPGAGGAMYNRNSNPTLINCTFNSNGAGAGSAMSNTQSSDPTLINCTFSGNIPGAVMYSVQLSSPTLTNCIVWGNGGVGFSGPDLPTVAYSDIEGGYDGLGNIDADPLFVDPDNGDLRLLPGSPCIDAANNNAVPKGIDIDLDGNPRFVDDPDTDDTGFGDPPIVDMGAYEFQVMDCPWDVNADGVVDHRDIVEVVHNLGRCNDPDNCPWDVNGDGIVNGRDVAAVAMHFGPCP